MAARQTILFRARLPDAMTSALYTRDILRLATAIPHLGTLDPADGTAERRSPVCGSRVSVSVLLDADGRVSALGQTVNACALGQASAAIMGAHAIGQPLAVVESTRDALTHWLAGEGPMPIDWPGLDVFAAACAYPARHAAIRLPFEALADAIRDAAA